MTLLPDDGETGDSSTVPDDAARLDPVEIPGSIDAAAADPVDGQDDSQPEKPKRSRPFWIEVPVLVLMALVIAIFIKTFLVQAFFIPSASMETTLNIDDRILVNKLAFRLDEPHRFDVVVFDSGTRRDESLLEGIRRNVAEAIGLSAPESDFIKRIIGLPGEVIEIRDNRVYVDGQAIAEPYLKPGTAMADFGPLEIAADHYFMMGDNRNQSSDSRFSGTVAHDRLVGRAFVIVWPPASWDGL